MYKYGFSSLQQLVYLVQRKRDDEKPWALPKVEKYLVLLLRKVNCSELILPFIICFNSFWRGV